MRVVWTPEALTDREAIFDYIGAGLPMRGAFDRAQDGLGAFGPDDWPEIVVVDL